MSEKELGNGQQAEGNSEPVVEEKLVPVSEAIRYRKRAQAAEKELLEMKELHEKQNEELKALNKQAELLKTPSSLQDTPPSQGESHLSQASSLMPQVSPKTQGVKESRTSGARTVLQAAARQAAGSGSRSDVQEYLRIRRQYV